MRNRRAYTVLALAVIVLAGILAAQNGSRTITVILEQPQQAIEDFTLVKELDDRLAIRAGLDVMFPAEDSTLPPAPRTRFDLTRILEWGQEIGSRYVIYLQVNERRLATRKRTSIPYLLSRYVVEGRLDGVYSLVDLSRSKVIGTWDLRTRLAGPRQWQIAEDYPDDPDLHMPAPEKVIFFKRLEEKAADEIMDNIGRHVKGR